MAEHSLDQSVRSLKDIMLIHNGLAELLDDTYAVLRALHVATLTVNDDKIERQVIANVLSISLERLVKAQHVLERLHVTLAEKAEI